MTVEELREAVSIKRHHQSWDENNFCESDLLLDSCAGIMEKDSRGCLRFVHLSIAEFFTGPSPFEPNEWASRFFMPRQERDGIVAKKLLCYLNFNDFKCGRSSNEDELNDRLDRFILLNYAAKNWHYHAHWAPDPDEMWKRFFDMHETKLENWVEVFYYNQWRTFSMQAALYRDPIYEELPVIPKQHFETITSAVLGIPKSFDDLQWQENEVNTKLVCVSSDGMSPLHHAVLWEHNDISLKLISLFSREDLDIISANGWTALNIAAHFGNDTVVDALLSAGANAHLTKYPAPTPLTNAVTGGFISIAARLLDHGAPIQQKSGEAHSTALHLACESTRRENKAMVSLLIEHGASIEEKGADGMTPFHYACRSGNADIVSILLSGTKKEEQKSLANQPARAVTSADLKLHFYNKGDPPLSLACLAESIDTIEILLRYGADPLAKDNMGQNAFANAVSTASSIEFLEQLFGMEKFRAARLSLAKDDTQTYRVAIPIDTSQGKPPLMLIPDDPLPEGYTEESWWPMPIGFSVMYNKSIDRKELLQLLQKEGINLEERGHAGMTLVMWATAGAFTDEIDYLLNEVGLDVNAKDDYGQTALFISVYRPPGVGFTQEDQERLCKVLLDHGASVNCVTKEGLSPIHLCSSASILELLLSKGADPKTLTQTEEYQATLAEIAAERGCVAVLRRLYEMDPTLVDGTNSDGRVPPLCKSMAEKEFDAFKFLLGVSNLDITTEDEYDVLDNAIDTEQDISIIRMIVEEFRKRHKSLDRFIVDKRTALHLAIERGRRYDVFELLLDNGADPLIRFPWWFEAEMDAEDTTEKGSEHGNGAEGVKSPEGPEGVMETTTSDAGVKEKTEDSGNEMRDGSVTETSAYAESPGDAVKSPNNGNYNLPADGTGNKEPSDKIEGDCDIGGENECEGAKEETEDPTTSGRQITILMYAAEHGLLDFAKKILNHPTGRGLLPDVNFGGCTALHYSTMPRNEEIVKLLLSYGADVNALDIYGRTPLHYADTVPTAEILLDNGADINVQAENGATTLHFAVMDPPHFDLFKVLLARGADYKVKDQDGLNPLDYAVSTFSLTMKAEAMYCIFKAEVRRIKDWRSSVLMTGILAVVGGLLLARFSQRRKILHASIFP